VPRKRPFPSKNSRVQKRIWPQFLPYILTTPIILFTVVFVLYPMFQSVIISFYDSRSLLPQANDYAGLKNYVWLFTSPSTLITLRVTLFYVVGTVICSVSLGLVAALLLNVPYRGRGLARAAITVPWGTPLVASALIWFWMFDPQYGVINYFLYLLHLTPQSIQWLITPQWALLSVILVDVWRIFPFGAIVLLTALQAVPANLYDAAAVDGAGSLSKFFHVTLPSIRPSLAITMLLYTIWGMKRFDTIWVLTQGGPLDNTSVMAVQIYREAFRNFRIGRASALAVVGTILSLIITFFYFRKELNHEKA